MSERAQLNRPLGARSSRLSSNRNKPLGRCANLIAGRPKRSVMVSGPSHMHDSSAFGIRSRSKPIAASSDASLPKLPFPNPPARAILNRRVMCASGVQCTCARNRAAARLRVRPAKRPQARSPNGPQQYWKTRMTLLCRKQRRMVRQDLRGVRIRGSRVEGGVAGSSCRWRLAM